MTGRSCLLAAVLVTLIACSGGDVDRGAEFGFDADTAAPAADINVLRLDRETAPSGIARLDGDILLPLGASEGTARATLRHLIDSLAAVDTMVAAIRITGFMIDPSTPGATEAQVSPVIMARWVPTDSIGVTGLHRTARYRIHFVVLEPNQFAAGSDPR